MQVGHAVPGSPVRPTQDRGGGDVFGAQWRQGAEMSNGKVRVTLTGSYIGCTVTQKRTLRALGLRKRDDAREHDTSPAVQGMINMVRHLISVDAIE